MKKLIQFRDQGKKTKRDLAKLESAVKESHTKALEELVLLFEWLDTLEPQPTNTIINLLRKSQEIEDKIESAMEFASKLADMKIELAKIRKSNDSNVIVRLFTP